MFFSNASKQDHRRVQKTAHSETGPLLNKTNICRFSSARLKLMTSRECADRENGIGLCTRAPVRPDICFGKCCGWSMALYSVRPCVCVSAWKVRYRYPRLGEAGKRLLHFLLQFIYPSMFIQVDEGECVSAGKIAVVFLFLQSLLSLTGNIITHQRSFCLYPILLWPLRAFFHIQHDNSPSPSLHQPASPCFLSLSRERLNLDENEIFISTQQLMAILIWYNFWCNISSLFFFNTVSSSSLSLPTIPSSILNTSSPLGLTLLKVELQSTITAFCGLLKYVWVISDETFAQTPARRISGSMQVESALSNSHEELITWKRPGLSLLLVRG